MDVMAILALVEKGITIADLAIKAGRSAAPAFDALKALFSSAKANGGVVSPQDMANTDAVLDGMLAEFNQDI